MESRLIQPEIKGIDDLGPENRHRKLIVETARGGVKMQLYQAANAEAGVIFVGGGQAALALVFIKGIFLFRPGGWGIAIDNKMRDANITLRSCAGG